LASAAIQLAMTAMLQYGWDAMPGPLQWWFSAAQVEVTSYVFYFVAGALAATHLDACLAWLRRHRRQAALGALGACVIGEGWYLANVLGGESPGAAANVFQPATLLLTAGVVVGLWMVAERWLGGHPVDGRLWRVVRAAGLASFGFYLAHMVTLLVITEQPVLSWLPTDRLPWVLGSAVRMAMVVTGTFVLTWAFRRTPLSRLLTGRPRVGAARAT
jgi:peptidoglycan/LPS O-acetylase OafA/YrhL